ncbi:MAG: acetylxylan esterase [Planctomycetia bacterium]|nr:acetylxylan esterase [Planctomycetia bacterium]
MVLFLPTVLWAGTPYFYGTTNKNPLSYQLGEEIIFSVHLLEDGQELCGKVLKWQCYGDDGYKKEGEIVSDQNPLTIKATLTQPGFVHLKVNAFEPDGTALPILPFQGSAGADWQSMKNVEEPDDFDSFWNQQKERLNNVPMQAELVPVDVPEDQDHLYYDVKINCVGAPVSGYYRKPKNAQPKSLPIRIAFIGYNYHSAFLPVWGNNALAVDPTVPLSWAEDSDRLKDGLIFNINAHGYENGKSAEYYEKFAQGPGKNYGFIKEENENRETSYFLGILLRAIRLLQWLKEQPEWDGQTIVVAGGSQGGFQALAAAGLDSEVSECYAFIPWLCNLGGHEEQGYFPSSFCPEYTKALRYFDAANHAKRIQGKVMIVSGLGDFVCPPGSQAILYNCISSPKKIEFRQGMQHPEEMANAEVFFFSKDWSIP